MKPDTLHTFHVPVMGTGFSIDTPVKVAKYGISSVISLVDDTLIEEMRQFYCREAGEPYVAITKDQPDHRARRITAYLNLVDQIVSRDFADLRDSAFEPGTEITKYFELLPDTSTLKAKYQTMLVTTNAQDKTNLQKELRKGIRPGDINVNIMTKLDRDNFAPDGTPLPAEFSDALAALRGYALSTLHSSIVFSAGINRRLYSYVENFKDFFADTNGYIKKRIVLKVSDYRSSFTQGKFFAKKGLWISEYRVESGLNCGGHAFATDGLLMGPILEEFKIKKQELINTLHGICTEALKIKNKFISTKPHAVKITAQGGIGTFKEDQFLLNYYQLDSTGWATPFLLCPEVTNVDPTTLERLAKAGEDDLYLSDVSPLGVPFNNLRQSVSDEEKERRVDIGRPGSACPKGHLVSNTEFTPKPICTASRQYQKLKLDQLKSLNLDTVALNARTKEIIKKACICNDLGEGPLINNKVEKAGLKRFPAVCPGPNLAYFSKIVTLREMADHIYGRINLLNSTYRPNMFISELRMYVDFLSREIQKSIVQPTERQIEYLTEFRNNLFQGIEYYKTLIPKMAHESDEYRQRMSTELMTFKKKLEDLVNEYRHMFLDSLTTASV